MAILRPFSAGKQLQCVMPEVAEVLELRPASFSFTVVLPEVKPDQHDVPALTVPVFVLALIGLAFTLQLFLSRVSTNGWAWLLLIPTLLLAGLFLMLGMALYDSRRKQIQPESSRAFNLTDLELQLEPNTAKLIVGKLLANLGSQKNLLQQAPVSIPLELKMDQAETWITTEAKASLRNNRLEYDFEITAPRLLRHAHPDAKWYLEFGANDQTFYRAFVTVSAPVVPYPIVYRPDRETQLESLLAGSEYELIAKAYNGREFTYKNAREPYLDEFSSSECNAVFTVSIHDLIDHAITNKKWLEKNIYKSRIGGDGSFYMLLEAGLCKYMFTERNYTTELFVSPNVRDVLEAFLTNDPRAVKLAGTDELLVLHAADWKDPYG
jgi:hypothetical protein